MDREMGWRPLRGREQLLCGLGALIAIALLSATAVAAAREGAEAEPATSTYDLTLVRASGERAAGASVRVLGADEELAALVADERGCVTVEDLVAGDPFFLLISSADGRERLFRPSLSPAPGRQERLITLYPPVALRGELRDEEGEPAAGVTVRASSWDRIGDREHTATTDGSGRFVLGDLWPGAYYNVAARRGPADNPTETWLAGPHGASGWDGWSNIGILLPEQYERSAPRPSGRLAMEITSDPLHDEWYDLSDRCWRRAIETSDPNLSWCPAPEGSEWIWRAGRPDHIAEEYGAVVEFRRGFALPPSPKGIVGWLEMTADDYAVVRINGTQVALANDYLRPMSFAIPAEVLRAGDNELRVTLRNAAGCGRDEYNPTGFAYRLQLIDPVP